MLTSPLKIVNANLTVFCVTYSNILFVDCCMEGTSTIFDRNIIYETSHVVSSDAPRCP
jgi:hypothetical protein